MPRLEVIAEDLLGDATSSDRQQACRDRDQLCHRGLSRIDAGEVTKPVARIRVRNAWKRSGIGRFLATLPGYTPV